ncbi:cAMP phosphodiesterases class-II-domain-containing protein [Lipomyces arxii]|uniref:cAMP phosphodiesterases class-II-domain-containing protein n=1 Tax=Lipomyces arxii TaxID=56418 RepID=UPI0034CF3E3B
MTAILQAQPATWHTSKKKYPKSVKLSSLKTVDQLSRPSAGSDRAAFELIVLGSSGGPLEFGVSGYIIKSSSESWAKNSLVAIDAGTFMAGVLHALRPAASALNPVSVHQQQFGTGLMPYATPLTNAAYVVRELVAAACITHSHLDHVSGFVLNSSCFTFDNPKQLCGLPWVIDDLKKHIFNNAIWPNLTNEGDDPIGLITLRRLRYNPPANDSEDDEEEDDEIGYDYIANGLQVRAYPVSHGCVHYSSGQSRAFESSAYFVRDTCLSKEILIFGDVEPDSISIDPRNRRVWIAAARKFARSQLSAIVIECSYASIQPEHSLFGHLSPPYLIQELKMFASLLKCNWAEPNESLVQIENLSQNLSQNLSETDVSSGVFGDYAFFGDAHMPAMSIQQQALVHQQQQNIQEKHHHPYGLHPHPHFHYHTKHKLMQQYSPVSSRRASAVSTGSTGSSGNIPLEDSSIFYTSTKPASRMGPLAGLVVVITHVKGLVDDEELVTANTGPNCATRPAESIILTELEELLANEDDLAGMKFVLAKTGQTLMV